MLTDTLKKAFNTTYNANFKNIYIIDEEDSDTPIATSYLGTPIYSNIEFEATSYRDFNDVESSFDGFTLDICLMNANSQNLIIETVVQGSNYSKMESINTGNYKITVQGFLDSTKMNVAPYIPLTQLNELRKVNIQVKVNSSFLNNLGVYEVVVNNVEFSEIEATRNLIALQLSLTSDEPIEVRLA